MYPQLRQTNQRVSSIALLIMFIYIKWKKGDTYATQGKPI